MIPKLFPQSCRRSCSAQEHTFCTQGVQLFSSKPWHNNVSNHSLLKGLRIWPLTLTFNNLTLLSQQSKRSPPTARSGLEHGRQFHPR